MLSLFFKKRGFGVLGFWGFGAGAVYSLMETQYHALVDIHYQYSPHFLAFLFPTLVLALQNQDVGNRSTSDALK